MSCALFGLANVVTIMYYIVDTTTGVSPQLPFVRCFDMRLLLLDNICRGA
jgi:hypothetical protein